jgi:filamentous hemagglutinin family protein
MASWLNLLCGTQAPGQMARDGSLGQTPGALSGPHYTIDVQNPAGQIRGNNLFHSFHEFNVNTGETATFTGPNHIANVINRVTGQNPSNIDGGVNSRATMPNANLFLINPNGLVVGPNASFNVGGAIHLGTADYVRMNDGAQFFANLAKQSTLTSAPVTAFGFLGERTAAPLTVQAGAPIGVDDGKSVSLVGGDVTISGRTITAPGGQITVASLTGAGEQALAAAASASGMPNAQPFTAAGQGTIHLAPGTTLQTSSSTGPAGSIFLRGGKFVMDQARLEANTSSKGTQSASALVASGNISIQADHATLSHGSTITTSTSGDGQAGNITFEVGTLSSNMGHDSLPLPSASAVTIAANSTGNGAAGTVFIKGPAGQPADAVSLSHTQIVANAGDTTIPTPNSAGGEQIKTALPGFVPSRLTADIEITAHNVALANGTVVRADTTGGADAGSITFNVGTMATQAGPAGSVLISSTSNCAGGCRGGQAGDIVIQGIPGVTPTSTRSYIWVARPGGGHTEVFEYYLARRIDLRGTDIHSTAIGNAPGGMVMMRAEGKISLTGANISVATQDFDIIKSDKPNAEFARNQGFSRVDILAQNVVLKNSTIKADAEVSDLAACPTCTEGPSAGEIWLRVGNSVTADNSSITNTSRGRAQAGLTKIVRDHHFSYGAIWEPDFPDKPTGTVTLNNSDISVEAQHIGLPGYLRIRADTVILNHSILNSMVKDVSNGVESDGRIIDVVGAGERGRVIAHGRDVQGSIVVSAKNLDITGGGIIAPTQGTRIGSRIELQADEVHTRPGTGPGGTHTQPRILDASDPTRVVILSSSSGSGGAGRISITGESVPMPEGTPFPPATSIHLNGTDVMTDTRSDALGGKVELKSRGPIELVDSNISANVTDVRPQSAAVQDQGGSIHITAGNLSVQSGGILALSRGSQNGGNIAISTQGPITLSAGATVSANGTGSGDAGSVTFMASGPINMNAGHVATSSMEGKGGAITLQGTDLGITNKSSITAESHGVKDAGKIALISGNNISITDSTISTEALKASGGDIKLTAPNTVMLRNSTLTASVGGGNETTGGKIDIDPQYVVIQNSNVIARAADGTGGRIAIQADQAVLVDPSSQIDATSSRGINGQILIQSPIQQLAGAIAPLPQAFAVAANLYGQRCAAQKGGQFSSFVQGARDGVPPQPGELLASPLLFESETAPPQMSSQIPPNLAAARLGLPEFEKTAEMVSATFSGCKS